MRLWLHVRVYNKCEANLEQEDGNMLTANKNNEDGDKESNKKREMSGKTTEEKAEWRAQSKKLKVETEKQRRAHTRGV